MQVKKLILSGGAALGAAAAFNAWSSRSVASLTNPLGGEEGSFHWRGHRISCTRRGSGPALLLVHSIHAAAWSSEWRHNVGPLARSHTVFTLDLLGFGRSDRPAIRYSAQLYRALIRDFVDVAIGTPCVLCAASLSAAYAIVLGARDPGRFPALILIEPTGLVQLNRPAAGFADLTKVVFDAPIVGTAAFNGLVSRASIRRFLRQTYADQSRVTDELVDSYFAAAHQPGAKHAPSALMAHQLNVDVRGAMRRLSQPALLVWGERATQTPVEDARGFLVLKPDLEVAILPRAGGLPHAERPEEFNEVTSAFLASTAGPSPRAEVPV
jgi:pimeloyl-ACP methyl ester carboxylesterase